MLAPIIAQTAAMVPLLVAASTQSRQLQRGTPENAAPALEQFTAVAVALAAAGVPDDGTSDRRNTAART